MDMEVRIKQLEAQLNEQMTRKVNLRLALRQVTTVIERLQGAIAFARECSNGTSPVQEEKL